MTTPPTNPEPDPADALDGVGDASPPPEMDLSKERLFEDEPLADEAAPPLAKSAAPLEPTQVKQAGPIFRASLSDALWLLWRRIGGNPVTELGCRDCGYPARHLTKRSCPECGADFMRQGLIDPADTRLGLVALAASWTLVIVIAGFATRPLVAKYVLPTQVQRFVSLDFVDRKPSSDQHRLTLFGERTVTRSPNDNTSLNDSIERMAVYLADKESTPIACDLNLTDSTYAFRPGGKPLFSGFPPKGRLDEDAIANWILFSGIDASRNDLVEHAHMAMAMLAVLRQPSSVALQHSPSGKGVYDHGTIRQIYAERSTQKLVAGYIPLVIMAWAALWTLGIAMLMLLTRAKIPKATV